MTRLPPPYPGRARRRIRTASDVIARVIKKTTPGDSIRKLTKYVSKAKAEWQIEAENARNEVERERAEAQAAIDERLALTGQQGSGDGEGQAGGSEGGGDQGIHPEGGHPGGDQPDEGRPAEAQPGTESGAAQTGDGQPGGRNADGEYEGEYAEERDEEIPEGFEADDYIAYDSVEGQEDDDIRDVVDAGIGSNLPPRGEFTETDKLHSLWFDMRDSILGKQVVVKEGQILDGERDPYTDTLESPLIEGAIAQMEMTQNKNKSAKKSKTYHLLVSFREKEGNWPSFEVMQEIGRRFVDKLGFHDHEYVCATHRDTDNFHMHIVVNKTQSKPPHNNISPEHDYSKCDDVCRACEKDFGLEVDNGMDSKSHDRFIAKLKDLVPEMIAATEDPRGWDALHEVASENKFQIRKKGAGLVFVDMRGKIPDEVKASQISRKLAMSALVKKIGVFKPGPDFDADEEARIKKDEVAKFKLLLVALRPTITGIIKNADSWFAIHKALERKGLRIERRGNGLVITNKTGSTGVAASFVAPWMSMAKLQERLGDYEDLPPVIPGGEPPGWTEEPPPHMGDMNYPDNEGLSGKARDFEAATWEESFERHVLRMKGRISGIFKRAENWADIHDELALIGLRIRKRGNGLVFSNIEVDERSRDTEAVRGKHFMKASSVDRKFSKQSLETKFGAFQEDEFAKERTVVDGIGYRRRSITVYVAPKTLWQAYIAMVRANQVRRMVALIEKRRRQKLSPFQKQWRQFVEAQMAVGDPVAQEIVRQQQAVIEALTWFMRP